MTLQPQVIIKNFEKWALDFVGKINAKSKQKRYILVFKNYVTKWVEAKPILFATENVVVTFIFLDIFTHFSVSREIVTYKGT